ncbi:MAG: transglutaminase-like domain-containing protein [Sulfolobales archaeon]|nr:hypothetical protein [Sulfolobales archaeon]MDW7969744.1 transglutaminase-like domain-containing protein [Sulfolobales archaeon]
MGKLILILVLILMATSFTSIILYIQLSAATADKELLNVRYSELLKDYGKVKHQIANLTEENNALKAELEEALIVNSRLRSEVSELRVNYDSLLAESKRLNEWLVGNISKYSEEVRRLKAELNATVSWYEELLKNRTTYISELETRLRSYDEEIRNLKDIVRRAIAPVDLPYENHTFNSEFLNRSVKSIDNYDGSLPELRGLGYEEFIKQVILWVANNTYYQYDLTVMKDYWKLPNETIKEEGGDCEDLAILGYALLKRVGLQHIYVISWNANDSGHVGVLIYVNGKWYLVDPGWAYVNDYEVLLRINVYRDEDKLFIATVHPSSIHPTIKNLLIKNGFARYVWYDYLSNKFVERPNIGREIPLKDMITNWPSRVGYEATVWTLITDEKTLITSNIDDVIHALHEAIK